MTGLVGWAVDALIASALLMAAVLLVRGPVRRAFGPQLAYALWALPALRLVLPPLPSGWWQAAAAPITQAGETVATVLVLDVAAPVAATPAGLPLGLIVALAWGLGAGGFLVWHLIRHARFCNAVVRTGEPLEYREGVTVLASPAAPGPLAFGIWRRYVAFPRDFAERYDADERALALAHELGHHARRDLLANWAALIVLALHWFNPLAWRAFHAFRADQELANDARVLAGCAPADRHAYGRAIVKAAHGGAVSAACHLHTISDLKGRLRMLTTSRTSRRRLAAGSAAVTLLVAGGLGLTASSTAAERISQTLEARCRRCPRSRSRPRRRRSRRRCSCRPRRPRRRPSSPASGWLSSPRTARPRPSQARTPTSTSPTMVSPSRPCRPSPRTGCAAQATRTSSSAA